MATEDLTKETVGMGRAELLAWAKARSFRYQKRIEVSIGPEQIFYQDGEMISYCDTSRIDP